MPWFGVVHDLVDAPDLDSILSRTRWSDDGVGAVSFMSLDDSVFSWSHYWSPTPKNTFGATKSRHSWPQVLPSGL